MSIDARCCELVSVPLIKVQEHGKKAVFKNPSLVAHEKIQMDGCVVVNETAADWVVRKPGIGTVVVELKGGDVEHGAKQVDATADFLKKHNQIVGKIAALIVSTSYPKSSTTIQKAQALFFRKHKGPLHVVTRNCEFTFERVLSASGPL
jgi:actin-like ATPase involved in cell morphogenesis